VQALEIFRRLGERRSEAPTLNNLALALVATGETDAAVERFEESLAILRELEDEQREGKVIANLGLTLLKRGDDERARELLATALEKLPPESPAAHRVEAELRRAG
jgi:tetratricopeptide (TPR) repeat protein